MKKPEEVIEFASSLRGQYIIGQALWYGIRELKKVKPQRRELSNIRDMEYLMNNLFNLFSTVKEAEKEFKKKKLNENFKRVKAIR